MIEQLLIILTSAANIQSIMKFDEDVAHRNRFSSQFPGISDAIKIK